MTNLAREFAEMDEQRITSREAMDTIEGSAATTQEKNIARSMVMNGDSRLVGNVYPAVFARNLEAKVMFWREVASGGLHAPRR